MNNEQLKERQIIINKQVGDDMKSGYCLSDDLAFAKLCGDHSETTEQISSIAAGVYIEHFDFGFDGTYIREILNVACGDSAAMAAAKAYKRLVDLGMISGDKFSEDELLDFAFDVAKN